MGNIQDDFTITNDGTIVRDNNPQNGDNLGHTKSNAGYIIAIVFFIGVSIIIGTLYLSVLNSRDFWIREHHRITQQLDDITQQLYDTEKKLAEKESLISSIRNRNIPLIITDIKMGNVYNNGDLETNYGSKIYSTNTMYLKPRIYYIGLTSGNKTFKVKLYRPSGTLSIGSSSPAGFSYQYTSDISIGENTLTLNGWGGETKGHWDTGTYRIEIWYDNQCLASKTFPIY